MLVLILKEKTSKKVITFLLTVLTLFYIFGFFERSLAAINSTVRITVQIPVCGNGIVEGDEECDGNALNSKSCSTQGFSGGSLSCAPSCEFVTSSCTNTPPVSNGGGGGGGGGVNFSSPISPVISTETTSMVNFSGYAYPKSTVTFLKDAQIIATTVADSKANFSINISGLSGGTYIFSAYSEDYKGNRSSLLTFPISVTAGTTTNIGGIFMAPTIALDKAEVKKGDNIAIFGQSLPSSEITISINSETEFFDKITSDNSGVYLYNFDTSILEKGQHYTKSKAATLGAISSFSKAVGFIVGNKTVLAEEKKVVARGDLNNDRRVNLVDFSIIAFWYNKPKPPTTSDLNGDGKVNLIDFSILAFNWTG